MTKCIAAHTAGTGLNMPPYINVSEQPDGSVRVIVRGPGVPDGVAGPGTIGEGEPTFRSPEAHIDLSADEWQAFVLECVTAAAIKRRSEREAAPDQVA